MLISARLLFACTLLAAACHGDSGVLKDNGNNENGKSYNISFSTTCIYY